MALTRDFKETIQARARRDPAFRKELLREAVESFLSGDVDTGKTVLRDYIHATVGFNELAGGTHHSPKSLMRMLGPFDRKIAYLEPACRLVEVVLARDLISERKRYDLTRLAQHD